MIVDRLIARARRVFARLTALEASTEKLLLNQGRSLSAGYGDRPTAPLRNFEFQIFSQFGEDGIIQRLIAQVPIAHRTFVEFGVEDFSEANCRLLMMKDNWHGLVIDGSAANVDRIRAAHWFWRHDLRATASFITPDNINDLIAAAGFDADLGLLSVDIDGMDYWVLSAISVVRPRIVVVEYNAVFGSERAIAVPVDPGFVRGRGGRSNLYFGASLGAFDHWARANGYALVGCGSAGINAFFVREDVRPPTLPALTVAEAFINSHHRESRDANGALTWLSGDARLASLRGLPVINVVSEANEAL
jgi:hypothetical protein